MGQVVSSVDVGVPESLCFEKQVAAGAVALAPAMADLI